MPKGQQKQANHLIRILRKIYDDDYYYDNNIENAMKKLFKNTAAKKLIDHFFINASENEVNSPKLNEFIKNLVINYEECSMLLDILKENRDNGNVTVGVSASKLLANYFEQGAEGEAGNPLAYLPQLNLGYDNKISLYDKWSKTKAAKKNDNIKFATNKIHRAAFICITKEFEEWAHKLDKDDVKKLLTAQTPEGLTALHFALYNESEPTKLFSYIAGKLDKEQLEKILDTRLIVSNSQDGSKTILQMIMTGSPSVRIDYMLAAIEKKGIDLGERIAKICMPNNNTKQVPASKTPYFFDIILRRLPFNEIDGFYAHYKTYDLYYHDNKDHSDSYFSYLRDSYHVYCAKFLGTNYDFPPPPSKVFKKIAGPEALIWTRVEKPGCIELFLFEIYRALVEQKTTSTTTWPFFKKKNQEPENAAGLLAQLLRIHESVENIIYNALKLNKKTNAKPTENKELIRKLQLCFGRWEEKECDKKILREHGSAIELQEIEQNDSDDKETLDLISPLNNDVGLVITGLNQAAKYAVEELKKLQENLKKYNLTKRCHKDITLCLNDIARELEGFEAAKYAVEELKKLQENLKENNLTEDCHNDITLYLTNITLYLTNITYELTNFKAAEYAEKELEKLQKNLKKYNLTKRCHDDITLKLTNFIDYIKEKESGNKSPCKKIVHCSDALSMLVAFNRIEVCFNAVIAKKNGTSEYDLIKKAMDENDKARALGNNHAYPVCTQRGFN